MNIKKILLHPITVFVSIGLGIILGSAFPELGPMAGEMGQVYMRSLQMCVLPLVAAAVFNSVVALCSNLRNMMGFLRGLLGLFSLGMLAATLFGILSGILSSLGGEIDSAAEGVLGSFVNQEEAVTDKLVLRNGFDFLHMIIPQNPFTAFADGSGLKILFFSIVMGIAFSLGSKQRVDVITGILGEVFDACIRVLNFLVLLLPFGMLFIFANQFSLVTFDVIQALGKLIAVSLGSIFAVLAINIFVLKVASRKKLLQTLRGISGTLMMAFGTASGFVTMPQMMKDMERNFKIDNSVLKLVVPLGINMSPQGTCLAISIFAIFFTQMYHIPLATGTVLIMIFGSMMISMAISGLPAIVGISLISALLESMGVPAGISSAIMLAVLPIIDPPLTMLNCAGTCTYAYLLGRKPANASDRARTAVRRRSRSQALKGSVAG